MSTPPPLLAYNASTGVPGHWTQISIHRLVPALFKRAILRFFARSLAAYALIFAAIFVAQILVFKAVFFNWTTYAALLCGAPVGSVMAFVQLRKMWKTLEVVIADEGLLRRGGGLPTMEIPRDEIKRFDLGRRRITVRTARPFKVIAIVRETEGFAEIRQRLVAWTEIPASRPTLAMIARRLALPLAGAAMSLGGTYLLVFPGRLWMSVLGLAMLVVVDTGMTIRFARASEIPLAQRVMMLVSIWLSLPPLVGLTALQHWMHR